MRFSKEQIKELQEILKKHYGLEYSDEQAQVVGLTILRFVKAKQTTNKLTLQFKENDNDEKIPTNKC